MARTYQPKYLRGGLANPAYKPDVRKGSRHVGRNRRGFVAWDGEGVNRMGKHGVMEHIYIMLVSSSGEVAYNPDGLSTRECFECLVRGMRRDPHAFHVGFAFSYDVNMMLRDVPHDKLQHLWAAGKCWHKDYFIQYRPRKEFALSYYDARVRVWDVWGFFQSSFVEGLRSYGYAGEGCTREEPCGTCVVCEIAAMKDQRSEFRLDQVPEMYAYCKRECALLQLMMEQFAQYLQDVDIKLSRFDGAGAVAAALLRKMGVKQHMRETPEVMQYAAAHAYFGGRIEMVRYGYNPHVYVWQYDLRSAYPTTIAVLPCLACGDWIHDEVDALSQHAFTLYHIRWEFAPDDVVCPFPWRDSYGSIYFPPTGEGWYWAPEIEAAVAAVDAGVVHGDVRIIERWQYVQRCNHRPFDWVPELYDVRARMRKEGVGAEKVLKLGLNSLYGKFAQRVGFSEGKAPPWHQLEWAGYVTSATRAALYRASFPVILSRDIVAYATDAIFATAPLPELVISPRLGDWDLAEHTGITAVQSGVYWCGEDQIGKTRGFAKDDIFPRDIVRAWKCMALHAPDCKTCGRDGDAIPWKVTRFVALGRALAGPKQFAKWRTWALEPKALSLTPYGTKRTLVGLANPKPHRGLILTRPTDPQHAGPSLSAPIKLPWLVQPRAFDADASRRDLLCDDESDDCYD